MRKLTKSLLNKGNSAFLLSLELFNKPTISYRMESFSLLFSNAWELLLKAYIYEDTGGKKLSIFRKKKRNEKRKSISIDDCLNKVFLDQNDPVRKNIEYISEIRNEASHLIVNELDPYFSRAFQAGVINYVDYLQQWFKVDINEKLNPGLISLISDKDRIADLGILRRKYNKEDFKSITHWIEKFDELDKLGNKATISIKHTIAIVKNPKYAEFVISSGNSGKRKAVIIEKVKDPNITHLYNRKLAILEIRKRIPQKLYFTEYTFEAYTFVKGIKKTNNDYFWKGKYSGSGQYSQKFIDEFIQAINKDPRSLETWRVQYRQHLKMV